MQKWGWWRGKSARGAARHGPVSVATVAKLDRIGTQLPKNPKPLCCVLNKPLMANRCLNYVFTLLSWFVFHKMQIKQRVTYQIAIKTCN